MTAPVSTHSATKPTRSYEKFHYALRPAKHIERKMLVEAFRRLIPFRPIRDYRYVGLGSVYFVDFALVHRDLGITDMLSIEDEPDAQVQRRFFFNRPFRSIRLRFGLSTNELPSLDWAVPTIAWLDYDGKLRSGVLTDAATFASKTVSGGLLAITLNCAYEEPTTKKGKERTAVEKFRSKLPDGKTPAGLAEIDLQGWGTSDVIRQVIRNEIVDALAIRNGVLSRPEQIQFEQVLNFRYQDGARMVTVAFVFFRGADRPLFERGEWDKLSFHRDDNVACFIQAPMLTFRELRYLEKQLPLADRRLTAPGLTREVLDQYERVYRYYPTFSEAVF